MPLDSPRPLLHYTARRHWINDPNGLIWHAGEYHLFYQYNPQGDTWGHMSWGHAVSPDLLHWQELPVAIAEDDDWMIFSGSVVVDHANSSGFGVPGVAPMVAIYTGSAQQPDAAGTYRQNQQLAYSLDRGRTWIKHKGNPVLDLGVGGFRDPKVFWHGDTARWVMLVSMADEGWLRFFSSPDLKCWTALSEWRHPLPGCRLWECPDLLRVPLEDVPGSTVWMLKWDVFDGHPAGGSGALAVFGEFDGSNFIAKGSPQWLDGGADFYAAIAFGAMPPHDLRCIWLGWMNNHRYGAATPTSPWRGQMSLPRELRARQTPVQAGGLPGWQLQQTPVREILSWRDAPLNRHDLALDAGRVDLARPGQLPLAQDIELEIEAQTSTRWTLSLCVHGDNAEDGVLLQVDRQATTMTLNRNASAKQVAHEAFSVRQTVPWPGCAAERVNLRVLVDAQSIEVFAQDGEVLLSSLVFRPANATGVQFESDAPVLLRRCQIWPLSSPRAAVQVGA